MEEGVYEQVTEIWIKRGQLEVMVEKSILVKGPTVTKAQRRKSTEYTQEGQGFCVARTSEREEEGMKPERQAGADC